MRQFKQETFFVVDYKDVRRLIQECFGMPSYNIDDVEEWANDSSVVYMVDLSDYGEEERQEVAQFIKNPETGNCRLGLLLLELAARKEIPEGKYLIDVCW